MKASIKKRLKKLEEALKEKADPLDPVIIYDPEAPLPDLSHFGDQVVILLPDNRRHLS
jgi:hypothetical protein